MSVFVDTGVFYAHHDRDANRHSVASDALTTVLQSERHGRVITSDYVYDEAVTLTRRRTGNVADAIGIGRRIRGEGSPAVVDLVHCTRETFETAVDVYERHSDHELSFTDAVTVALVRFHDIDAVLTFDDDFDGIVDRLPPAEIATP